MLTILTPHQLLVSHLVNHPWERAEQAAGLKVSPSFIGPFEIDSLINPVSVHLKRLWNIRIHNVFHVSRLKP